MGAILSKRKRRPTNSNKIIPEVPHKDGHGSPQLPTKLSRGKERYPSGSEPRQDHDCPSEDLEKSAIHSVPVQENTFDIESIIQRILKEAVQPTPGKGFCLRNHEVIQICKEAREVFMQDENLMRVKAPVKIVGDIHGQFQDLIRMFNQCGFPQTDAKYLFLGDYVDRGKCSLETMTLLFCYKIKYPSSVVLLRGNHEAASVNRVYGFYDECKRRCNTKVWKSFTDTFNCLPIAAIVENRIFCVHGGLSPSLHRLTDIAKIPRPSDIPEAGLFNDLLWSDPGSNEGWELNDRGVSYTFGRDVVRRFLNEHDLDLVCRAHMVVEDGYEFFGDRGLVTLFSAPNYCGEFNNSAAVMCVDPQLMCSFIVIQPQLLKRPIAAHHDLQ